MELEFTSPKKVVFNRVLSNIDKFVLDFTNILSFVGVTYIVVSSYVAILFGRSRNTEDVDILVEKTPLQKFNQLWKNIPCMEVKFAKDELDTYSLGNCVEIILNGKLLRVSPFEIQIAYKLFLGSNKDVEDARFLYKLFREKIDSNLLQILLSS